MLQSERQNGAVTRIGTKRGEASHVRRSDRLLKPQLCCVLHFGYCAMRLHSFCFMVSCRFASCAICSLVAGFVFTLMVYRYRIIVLWRRRLITLVIRGKISSLISWLFAGATGVAEILRAACSSIARLPEVSSPWVMQLYFAYFCVLKSPCLAIDKTQQVGVNLHTCGFKPTAGLQ